MPKVDLDADAEMEAFFSSIEAEVQIPKLVEAKAKIIAEDDVGMVGPGSNNAKLNEKEAEEKLKGSSKFKKVKEVEINSTATTGVGLGK